MASPSQLGLDCKTSSSSHHNNSYSMLLRSFGDHHLQTTTDQTIKLEEFLSRLEEERLKIDAFKRELPLCMQLLTNAMEASRQQLEAFRGNEGTRQAAVVLEEFMAPVKQLPSEEAKKTTNPSDKANWMTSAQLWSQTSELGNKQQSKEITDHHNIIGFNIINPNQQLVADDKHRNSSGGAFLPFSKERNSTLPELALASSCTQKDDTTTTTKHVEAGEKKMRENNNNHSSNDGVVIDHQGNKGSGQTRKARRCWSPDLHRRFVNALQMLGGSQVATPKQIRELMKVDGLTNDEVKSHLQKYRLHTRRPSPSAQTGAPAGAQLVVLGGIWVPPEYATAHTATPSTIYGSHPTTHHHVQLPHYCAPPPGQEFYTTTTAVQQQQQQLLPPPQQQHLHVYKTTTPHGHGSPETAGDRSESIEDGKSESSSWKGESCENDQLGGGDHRKGLAELESNNNERDITLKF